MSKEPIKVILEATVEKILPHTTLKLLLNHKADWQIRFNKYESKSYRLVYDVFYNPPEKVNGKIMNRVIGYIHIDPNRTLEPKFISKLHNSKVQLWHKLRDLYRQRILNLI